MTRVFPLVALIMLSACHHHHEDGGSDGGMFDAASSDSASSDGGGQDGGGGDGGSDGFASGDPTETIPGTGWSVANDGLYGAYVWQMSRSPASPDVVYAGSIGGWLARSDDRGATWQMMHHFQPYGRPYSGALLAFQFTVDPKDARRVWVELTPPSPAPLHSEISRSDDGGKTWTTYQNDVVDELSMGAALWGIAHNPDMTSSVVRSTDGGATFPSKPQLPNVTKVIADPMSAEVAYALTFVQASSGYAIWRTADGGATWTDVSPAGTSGSLWQLAVSPLDGKRLWATMNPNNGGAAPWRSDDGGTTWHPLTLPISDVETCLPSVTSADIAWCLPFALDHKMPMTPLAITTDGGATWSMRPMSYHFLSPRDDNDAIAWDVYADPMHTTDGTQTWSRAVDGYSAVYTTATALSDDGTIYVGSESGQIYRSTDRGAHFLRMGEIPSLYAISAIAVDATNHDVVYITTESSSAEVPYVPPVYTLLKSTDGGATFTGLSTNYTACSASPSTVSPFGPLVSFIANGQTVVATTDACIYSSSDAGASWTATLSTGGVLTSSRTVPGTSNLQIIAIKGTMGGDVVQLSTDLGATWSSLPASGQSVYFAIGSAVDANTFYGFRPTYDGNTGYDYVEKYDGSMWNQLTTGFAFDTDGEAFYGAAAAATNGADALLVTATRSLGANVGATSVQPVFWTSLDGGQTWQAIVLPSDPASGEYAPVPQITQDGTLAVVTNPGDGVYVNATGIR